MNEKKYARLSIVVDRRTNLALRSIASVMGTGVSEVVRELIAEPAAMMADSICSRVMAGTPEAVRAVDEQVEMFVEGAYGDYLASRSTSHG